MHLRNREKRWCQDQLDAQECPDPQDTQEKHKSPPCQTSPCQKRKNKKKVKVVHSKEYKIRQPKKRPVVKKCSLCSESFDSQLELNLHTKSVHKYRFMCSSRQCGKTFGSLESLKKHGFRHGDMKYLCQVCGQNFPFASDLASHASIHSAEKKFKCTYPKCIKMYKTKAEYNRHYNYRHKQKSAESQEIKCKMCDKMFSKVKYLKELMKSHMDDLPFGCHLCGKRFKWKSGCKLHIDGEHKKESLSDEF